ncbi:class A beta-lactamase-related serine hydrolase [Sphingomonas sp. MG17]|uniref:Class A beta-lactamase-related serine hydrolase n=1 Tax=Sphingomonas tagetis TaxID=2949092 RepID=A0A9X2HI85_9SPHN|nr:serine hydrolase [Sphingomonas tagetis]MCP3730102.1 class A beta-lactamase-related serine hydrolase [Sphingomonas tagetis]
MTPWRLVLALLTAWPAVAHAQTPDATPAAIQPAAGLEARIAGLATMLNGNGDFEAYFADGFKATIPRSRWDALVAQIKTQHGPPVKVETVIAAAPYAADVKLGFEKSVANIHLVADPAAPHKVTGLLIRSIDPRGDSAVRIAADFRKLPGKASFGVYALAPGGPVTVSELAASESMPIGSAFKLWILAEAARQTRAGLRTWSEIVPLGERSLPSGVMQRWPKGAPVTLHTLAAQMISISDNTATDTLLHRLGREQVEAMVTATGVADPQATLPVLSTIELFRLKAPANAALVANWAQAGAEGRRRILRDNAARIAATAVEPGMFGDKPLAPQVEWFASAGDMARVLDWLRRNGGEQALDILAINPGTPSAALFDYAGFKGGSEPGVIFASFLVKTKAGNWYAVTGGWTRQDGQVDNLAFASLMNRLLATVAAR